MRRRRIAPRAWNRVPDSRPLAGALAAGIYSQGALVVTGVLTARSLGPTDRGYWALLILLPAVLQQVGTAGLPLATTYFIATQRSREPLVLRVIRTPALVQTVALTALQAAGLALLVRGEPHRVRTAAIFSLLLIAGSLADMYGKAILQGQGRYTALNIFRTTMVTLSLVGIVVLFAAGHADLVPIAAVWVSANLVAGLLTLSVALRGRRRESVDVGHVSLRAMFRFGLRGFLGNVSPVETFRVDQAVIGLFLPPRQLGLYVAGLAFTNLPGLISRSIGMIALPQIARVRDNDGRPDIWRFFWVSVVLTGVVIAVLEASAGFLVPLFFGSDFKQAVTMARILLVGAFFYAARRVLTDSASGAGMPGLGSIAELTSWFFLLPLMLLFVGPWEGEGVATALAISAAISLLILVLLVRRSARRKLWSERLEVPRVQPSVLGEDL